MLDEGWKLLDDPLFTGQIKDWLKTIRKQNALLGLATQSASDAAASPISDTIIEQSPPQIFLPNPKARESEYCGAFRLSAKELEIVRTLDPSSHFFLLRHGSSSQIVRLDLSGAKEFLPVLSGRTETVRMVEKMRAAKGEHPKHWLGDFMNGVYQK
jgi:type IV secretion system protein VirB4